MFTAAKDRITSSVAQKFINSRVERYGRVTSLRLDSKRKSGEIECTLLGESRPVRVVVERYSLRHEPGKTLVRIDAVSCDRPWLENIVRDLARDRWFELPGWAAAGL